MKATFKFRKVASDLFGHIYRPYADVLIYGKNGKQKKVTMLVDSGADYTLLPRREASLLGIDLSRDCTKHVTRGVGGPQTVYLYRGLDVELAGEKLKIPAGFLAKNDVPPLLGRHQFMELFKICLHEHVTSFEPD